jgi:lysophospholipase L1-like esterase
MSAPAARQTTRRSNSSSWATPTPPPTEAGPSASPACKSPGPSPTPHSPAPPSASTTTATNASTPSPRLGSIARAHEGPFDAIIIALGTNDAKAVFDDRQSEVAANAAALIRRAKRTQGWGDPRVFVLLPPPVTEPGDPNAKYAGAPARLAAFRNAFKQTAAELDAEIIDPTPLFHPDPARLLADGVHFTDEGNDLLARAIESALRRRN